MEKKLYSIGETARITGISVQTLRNYSNTPMLPPAYINPETGYRYFSFGQFHIIDRIRYLRSFHLSLNEIQKILSSGNDVKGIEHFLHLQKKKIEDQIASLKKTSEDIQWYIDYFSYNSDPEKIVKQWISHMDAHTLLYVDIKKGSTLEDTEIALERKKTDLMCEGFRFRRQYGYILSYDALIRSVWKPLRYYTYVAEMPEKISPALSRNLLTIPERDYMCCTIRLHHLETLHPSEIAAFFQDKTHPSTVFADEHEDNLQTYHYCPYELRFPIDDTIPVS